MKATVLDRAWSTSSFYLPEAGGVKQIIGVPPGGLHEEGFKRLAGRTLKAAGLGNEFSVHRHDYVLKGQSYVDVDWSQARGSGDNNSYSLELYPTHYRFKAGVPYVEWGHMDDVYRVPLEQTFSEYIQKAGKAR